MPSPIHLLFRLLCILVVAVLPSIAAAQAAVADWSGSWDSRWREVARV
jgi:hypothetical protein